MKSWIRLTGCRRSRPTCRASRRSELPRLHRRERAAHGRRFSAAPGTPRSSKISSHPAVSSTYPCGSRLCSAVETRSCPSFMASGESLAATPPAAVRSLSRPFLAEAAMRRHATLLTRDATGSMDQSGVNRRRSRAARAHLAASRTRGTLGVSGRIIRDPFVVNTPEFRLMSRATCGWCYRIGHTQDYDAPLWRQGVTHP